MEDPMGKRKWQDKKKKKREAKLRWKINLQRDKDKVERIEYSGKQTL